MPLKTCQDDHVTYIRFKFDLNAVDSPYPTHKLTKTSVRMVITGSCASAVLQVCDLNHLLLSVGMNHRGLI
jgi:RNA polymerase-interacting CarD/CdnL/TRCF family regulator